MGDVLVLPADAPRRVELERRGWRVVARSFGAQLDGDAVDRTRLRALVDRAGLPVRALDVADVDAVLALDAADHRTQPGQCRDAARAVRPERATPSATRRGFGAWSGDDLVAMTFVDVLVGDDGAAETGRPRWSAAGHRVTVRSTAARDRDRAEGRVGPRAPRRRRDPFRTGGSADNPAIIAANTALGYVRDEEWVTLEPGAP